MKQVGEVEGLQVRWKIVLIKLSRMNSTEEEKKEEWKIATMLRLGQESKISCTLSEAPGGNFRKRQYPKIG